MGATLESDVRDGQLITLTDDDFKRESFVLSLASSLAVSESHARARGPFGRAVVVAE